MVEPRILQNSFNAGEIDPLAFARIDLAKYAHGCEVIQNYVPLLLGGVTRRAGTKFVAEVKDSTKKVRLIPLEISDSQSYTIEAGHLYFRFYTNGARLESGGAPVEVATPYTETDLPLLRWVQAADFLYLVHPNHPLFRLRRTSATSFVHEFVQFTDGPYLPENAFTTRTLTLTGGPPWTTGSTLTMTAVGHTPFVADHAGANGRHAIFRLRDPAAPQTATTWVVVTGFTSSAVVTVVVKGEPDVPAGLRGIATSLWREGALSAVQGFARAIAFNEESLWIGGARTSPSTFFGSVSGNYEDFTPGTAADDAKEYTLSAQGTQLLQWVSGGLNLLFGTLSTEFSAEGSQGDPITPTNILVSEQTNHGSAAVAPVRFGNSLFFVQRAGRALREMFFESGTADAFVAPNALIMAGHLTESATLIELAHQFEPIPVIWALRSDGVLLSLTYDKIEQVAAWARVVTDGKFESMTVIPHPTAGRAQSWYAINRTIGGVTRRYIEFSGDVEGSFYGKLLVDSAVTYSGSDLTSLTGLLHLEGKTVHILGDGAAYPPRVVVSGTVAVDPPVDVAEVGLPYTPQLKPLPPEDARFGPLQGVKKNRAKTFIKVKDTLTLKVNGNDLPFRSTEDLMDSPPPLFSGNLETNVIGWDPESPILIEQDQPLPSTILAVFGIFNVGD